MTENTPTTAISLVALNTVEKVKQIINDSFHKLKFELSYEMSRETLERMRPFLKEKVVSVHAACPNVEFFPNLASHDESVLKQSFKDLEMSLDTANSFGAKILVVHPGYATDKAIPSDNIKREPILTGEEFFPFVLKKEGSICQKDYTISDQYNRYKDQALSNLEIFASTCKEQNIILAVENLNPRVGYLFQTPHEMLHLVKKVPSCSICLDVGHLWVSSCLYGFDFIDGLKRILATGKVATTHLHSNSSRPITEGEDLLLEDSHSSLEKYGFPYKEVIKEIYKAGANLVLEVKEKPLENHNLLMNELKQLKN